MWEILHIIPLFSHTKHVRKDRNNTKEQNKNNLPKIGNTQVFVSKGHN